MSRFNPNLTLSTVARVLWVETITTDVSVKCSEQFAFIQINRKVAIKLSNVENHEVGCNILNCDKNENIY